MTDGASDPVSIDDHLCYGVYSAGMAIQRLYKPLLDEMRLTYPQYLVLCTLWRRDGRPIGSIAEELALESSTVTPVVKRLESAHLVLRTRMPDNERVVVVTLTTEGRALKARAGELGVALQHASGQTNEDLQKLNRQIVSLREALYRNTGELNTATEEPC